jgi:hypothetical protein
MPQARPEIRAAKEPLTNDEFKRALEQGLGRAILCLKKHDPTPYKEIILETCLKDTRYDAQCEGSRVPYLMEAIDLCHDEDFFRDAILERFPATPNIALDDNLKCQEFVDLEFRDSYFFSNTVGAKKPRLECRRSRLYQTSIHSKTTPRVSDIDPIGLSKSNSHFNVAKKLSATALSQQAKQKPLSDSCSRYHRISPQPPDALLPRTAHHDHCDTPTLHLVSSSFEPFLVRPTRCLPRALNSYSSQPLFLRISRSLSPSTTILSVSVCK